MPIENNNNNNNNNNKRKFDFFKDYSHLSPEDQAIRSRLRDMIRGAEVSSKKHNTINSFELQPSIFKVPKKDQAFVNQFEQMQARRKEAQKLSYTKLKRSKTQSCLSMLESHLPQKNLKF